MNQKIKSPDWWLFLITIILLSFGVVMVFDASYPHAIFYHDGDKAYWVKRQIMWACIGLAGLFIAMRIPYEKWKSLAIGGLVVSVILLIATKFVGHEALGGQRWIGYGPVKIQPSEIAKLSVVLFLATIFSQRPHLTQNLWTGVLPILGIALVAIGLVERQPDLGTAMTMFLTTIVVFFAAGTRVRVLAGILAIVGIGVFLLVLHEAQTHSFRWKRLITFVQPEADPRNTGYQITHSMIALGTGGWTGLGFGQSREKLMGNLPAQRTDFIFAIVGEEFGLIGTGGVLLMFLFFTARGLHIAATTKDPFGALLATGITGMVTVQALLNMAVVTATVPTTGIPLPFISYGGSSLVPTLFAIGILLNVSRGVTSKAENYRRATTASPSGSANVARQRLLGRGAA